MDFGIPLFRGLKGFCHEPSPWPTGLRDCATYHLRNTGEVLLARIGVDLGTLLERGIVVAGVVDCCAGHNEQLAVLLHAIAEEWAISPNTLRRPPW